MSHLPLQHLALPVEDGALPLTFVESDAPGAAVVILPSAFGVGPELEEQLAELAEASGLAAALDPFFRDDGGFIPYGDRPRVMERLGGLDREKVYRDLRATIDWARSRTKSGRVVVVGVCFGGPFALRAAADGTVDGVVTWHGTRLENHLERAQEIRCPLRLHFGEVDPITPPPVIEAVRRAFAGHDARVVVHPGATHGFSHRRAEPWNPEAERAAMDAVRELVREVMAS